MSFASSPESRVLVPPACSTRSVFLAVHESLRRMCSVWSGAPACAQTPGPHSPSERCVPRAPATERQSEAARSALRTAGRTRPFVLDSLIVTDSSDRRTCSDLGSGHTGFLAFSVFLRCGFPIITFNRFSSSRLERVFRSRHAGGVSLSCSLSSVVPIFYLFKKIFYLVI